MKWLASGLYLGSSYNTRNNNFDLLRFAFASLVLIYHCFPLLLGSGMRTPWKGEALAAVAGGSSVDGFFLISGFLVTASWMRSPLLGVFLRKRALRIYPGFILASFFCAFVAGPLGTSDLAAYWHHFKALKFLLYLGLLPADVVGPNMAAVFVGQPYPSVIDGSFWTLRYEFELYLLVALLGGLGLYRGRRAAGLALLSLLLCVVYAASQLASFTVVPNREFPWVGNLAEWIRLAACFFSGMTFYLWRNRIPLSPVLCGVSFGVLFLTATHPRWFNAALPLFGSYALFYLAFDPRIRLHGFARRGDLSYGIYLYAFPIQQLLVHFFRLELTPLRLFLATFPLTLLCAALSWHLVEKPSLKLKKNPEILIPDVPG